MLIFQLIVNATSQIYKYFAKKHYLRCLISSTLKMHYIFVINGREDKSFIRQEVEQQISSLGIDYEFYVTTGEGDATRFVNIYCDLNPKKETCFVACGGSGTTTEVASGIVGKGNKYLAILTLSGTNDLTKCFPDRDFSNAAYITDGENLKIDALKVNDNYAINVVSVGMDAKAAYYANLFSADGLRNSYMKGILKAMAFDRMNRIKVIADGEHMNRRNLLLASFANGQYYGGGFRCAPYAEFDDGLIDVCLMKNVPLFIIAYAFKKYEQGLHLKRNFLLRRIFKYRQAKHIDLISKGLIYVNLDGEIIASRQVSIDILDKSVNLIIPKK